MVVFACMMLARSVALRLIACESVVLVAYVLVVFVCTALALQQ
jgi:hypothetical protein